MCLVNECQENGTLDQILDSSIETFQKLTPVDEGFFKVFELIVEVLRSRQFQFLLRFLVCSVNFPGSWELFEKFQISFDVTKRVWQMERKRKEINEKQQT